MLYLETQRESELCEYRAYVNTPDGTEYRYLSRDGDIRELDEWLHGEVHAGRAYGGDIEEYARGFGWLVYED